MINKIPLEIDPPTPMPSPPLRRRPSLIPQFSAAQAVAPTATFLPIFD